MGIPTATRSLTIAVCLGLTCVAGAQEAKPEFSIAISGPATVKAGLSVRVDITVTNVSNHVIVFDRNVPGLGERNFNIDVIDSHGTQPPSTKYMKAIRREDQGPGPLIVLTGNLSGDDLKPGESLKESADLQELFDLQPGMYTVQIWRPDFQRGHVLAGVHPKPGESDLNKPLKPGLTKSNPRPVPMKFKATAKSNTITIAVTRD